MNCGTVITQPFCCSEEIEKNILDRNIAELIYDSDTFTGCLSLGDLYCCTFRRFFFHCMLKITTTATVSHFPSSLFSLNIFSPRAGGCNSFRGRQRRDEIASSLPEKRRSYCAVHATYAGSPLLKLHPPLLVVSMSEPKSVTFFYFLSLVQFAPQASTVNVQVSALRLQRFFRSLQGDNLPSGHGAAGLGVGKAKSNKLRRLKHWIPRATEKWKTRRRERGKIIFEFLRDARLSKNLKAIYRFRRKVMRCVCYCRFFLFTRIRLKS